MAYTHGTIVYLQVLARSSRASKVYEAALRQSHESTFVKVFRNPRFRCLGVSLKPVPWVGSAFQCLFSSVVKRLTTKEALNPKSSSSFFFFLNKKKSKTCRFHVKWRGPGRADPPDTDVRAEGTDTHPALGAPAPSQAPAAPRAVKHIQIFIQSAEPTGALAAQPGPAPAALTGNLAGQRTGLLCGDVSTPSGERLGTEGSPCAGGAKMGSRRPA